jgi:hypothetical protein
VTWQILFDAVRGDWSPLMQVPAKIHPQSSFQETLYNNGGGLKIFLKTLSINSTKKSLFPTQLVVDELGTPFVENGRILIEGWIVGTQSFTLFEISKGESESESSWKVSGKILKFKSDAEVRKALVAVDPVVSAPGKPTVSEQGQDERLGSAHTLPAQLRRMLLSVSNPTFYYSTIWRSEPNFPATRGDYMTYEVPVVTHNGSQLVAMRSQQRVDFSGGESKATAIKMISTASWETKVVRASI